MELNRTNISSERSERYENGSENYRKKTLESGECMTGDKNKNFEEFDDKGISSAEKNGAEYTNIEDNSENGELSKKLEREKQVATVSDFLDYYENLKVKKEEAEDDSYKLICLQIAKIEMALNAAGLNPAEVKVEHLPDGVLGIYVSNTREIALSINLLEEGDERLIKTTAVHELVHKADKIYDEGMAQIMTRRRTSATTGIYENEQSRTEKVFSKTGLNKAIEFYDIDNPKKLFEIYLKKGLEERYGGTQKRLEEFIGNNPITKFLAKRKIEKEAKKIESGMIEKYKKAVPELYDFLKEKGYDIKTNVKRALVDLANEKKKKSE